jgi:hypothetical protein
LLTDNEEQWDKAINNESYEDFSNDHFPETIHVRVCGEILLTQHSSQDKVIRYLVVKYDNDNIRITIDTSQNHGRSAHIHIGIKEDKYHSASIAINDGTILNNTGKIADWKIKRIVDWIADNRQILEKMYRCINLWGDTPSADKQKDKLSDI